MIVYHRTEATGTSLRNRFRNYGIGHFDRDVFERVYRAHTSGIQAHFYTRHEQKLLVMNICAGEGYGVLCPFLGVDVIDEPFPHQNRRPD